MKKITRLLALLCALALAVACFAGCEKEKDVLTVGTNSEFPPFEYKEGGETVGIDMDIMKEVASILGMELKISDMEFDSLPNALAAGQIDCIAAGFTSDPTREETMDFSDTYYEARQSIIVRADSTIASKDDLTGKKLGAQSGTTGESVATDITGKDNVKGYSSAILACEDLLTEKLDAVIVDDNPARVIADEKGDKIKVIENQFDEEYYGIAVKKGNSELLEKINDALKQIKENGKMDEIVKKYV